MNDINKQTPNQKDEGLAHKVGDTVEKLGEKITRAGAAKVGKFVYDTGDKIEHMNDKKNP